MYPYWWILFTREEMLQVACPLHSVPGRLIFRPRYWDVRLIATAEEAIPLGQTPHTHLEHSHHNHFETINV